MSLFHHVHHDQHLDTGDQPPAIPDEVVDGVADDSVADTSVAYTVHRDDEGSGFFPADRSEVAQDDHNHQPSGRKKKVVGAAGILLATVGTVGYFGGAATAKSQHSSTSASANTSPTAVNTATPPRHPAPQKTSPNTTPKTSSKPNSSQTSEAPVATHTTYKLSAAGKSSLESLSADTGSVTFDLQALNSYPNIVNLLTSNNPRAVGQAFCESALVGLKNPQQSDLNMGDLLFLNSNPNSSFDNAWSNAYKLAKQGSASNPTCTFTRASSADLTNVAGSGSASSGLDIEKFANDPNQTYPLDDTGNSYLLGGRLKLSADNAGTQRLFYDGPVILRVNKAQVQDQQGNTKDMAFVGQMFELSNSDVS